MIAPNSKLVESVARAISQWMNGKKLPVPPNWERLQESTRLAYLDQAQAALDACRAEELADALRQMRREYGVVLSVSGLTLVTVDKLLAKMDSGAA
jgi:hypothetical protein